MLEHLRRVLVGKLVRIQDITGCEKNVFGVCVAIRPINEAGHFMLELRGSYVSGMWFGDIVGDPRYVGFYPQISLIGKPVIGKVSKYSLGIRNIHILGFNCVSL